MLILVGGRKPACAAYEKADKPEPIQTKLAVPSHNHSCKAKAKAKEKNAL
jgi:hypothetical protein